MDLCTRAGSTQTPNAQDAKGRPAWHHTESCYRCGGLGGSESWRHTGWTCYQCDGTLQTVLARPTFPKEQA